MDKLQSMGLAKGEKCVSVGKWCHTVQFLLKLVGAKLSLARLFPDGMSGKRPRFETLIKILTTRPANLPSESERVTLTPRSLESSPLALAMTARIACGTCRFV